MLELQSTLQLLVLAMLDVHDAFSFTNFLISHFTYALFSMCWTMSALPTVVGVTVSVETVF